MPRPYARKARPFRVGIAMAAAFASAALFGLLVASALSLAEPRFRQPVPNPFESSRYVQ